MNINGGDGNDMIAIWKRCPERYTDILYAMKYSRWTGIILPTQAHKHRANNGKKAIKST